MSDDIEMYLANDSSGYLESLIKSRQYLKDDVFLLERLNKVIEVELDLAMLGANKAKSEILKKDKPNVRPIK